MDADLRFEVIFILEVLCREDQCDILELRRDIRWNSDEEDTLVVSFNNYYKTFKLIKSQLELLFKLLNLDIRFVTGERNFNLGMNYFYITHADKDVVRTFMRNFQISQEWEEYINYKSKKEAQRVENLLRFGDINPYFLDKDPYYLNKFDI